MYFYRKGRGLYRSAPPESLKAALAGIERKRREATLQAEYRDELVAGRLPDAIREQARELLFRPDRNRIEFKALVEAAAARRTTPERLMLEVGAVRSPADLHRDRFVFEQFPRGVGFPDVAIQDIGVLPLADVAAFSIDDEATTEIDDALSVTAIDSDLPGAKTWRIGVHIARAGPGNPPRRRDRRHRARPLFDGLFAGREDHDAAGRGRRGVHARGRARLPGVVALCRCGRGRGGLAHRVVDLAHRACIDRRQPAPQRARRRRHRGEPGERQGRLSAQERAHRVVAFRARTEREAPGRARRVGTEARVASTRRLQLPRRRGGRTAARRDRRAAPRRAARHDRRGVDDPGQQHVGKAARRSWRDRHLSCAGRGVRTGRAGADGHASCAARGSRRRAVRVEHVAAAALRRPRQTSGRSRRASKAGRRWPSPRAMRSCSRSCRVSMRRTRPTRNTRRRWNANWCLRWLAQEGRTLVEARATGREDHARLLDIPLLVRVPGMAVAGPAGMPSASAPGATGVARGQRVELEILDTDLVDLTVQCRLVAIIEEVDALDEELDEGIDDVAIVEAGETVADTATAHAEAEPQALQAAG